MTKVQFVNGRDFVNRANNIIFGKSNETVEDLFDDIQLAYNDDLLCREDYKELVNLLSPVIERQ